MSGLTPEAARAAAEWLSAEHHATDSARELRAEADRLEAATKTPGQVLAEASGFYWADLDQYAMDKYADRAAAVIAHHVGPGRVVAKRADLGVLVRCARKFANPESTAGHAARIVNEALS